MSRVFPVLLLAALLAGCSQEAPAPQAAAAAAAAAIPVVNVGISNEACQPMQLTVQRGKTQFMIKNNSGRTVEWEILKGVYVVEERENIAPGFSQKLTARLEPGKYEMTCGLLSNPHGVLIVE
ncbi:hypothetical protein DBR44_04995 [Aquitalea sp. FJL05]|uniref:cupredoxin domain-containing protein n=1 Tax=Aquitalea TaxID=407217 RepID=UPI000F596D54|nr:hypothetical protein DBR44_04995 [Aquitalea sp. FJL05]